MQGPQDNNGVHGKHEHRNICCLIGLDVLALLKQGTGAIVQGAV